MSTNTRQSDESTDLEKRDVRALVEKMTVLADVGAARGADEMFVVTTESGSSYTVDLRIGACGCPDAEHRDPEGGCKHVRRAQFATGTRAIPSWVELDVVDPQLGEHVAGPVATDGGVIEVDAEQATLDDDQDDEGCDECAALPEGWPCAECYIVEGEPITEEAY